MQNKIKNHIERCLRRYLIRLKKRYVQGEDTALLFRHLEEFILRPAKRIRPILLVIGYLGFARKLARGLYETALATELLHDFMLVHDDIIDKSHLRRGKPAMHKMLEHYLRRYKGRKFTGQDLAIVAGDIMYAMAIDSFLSINERPLRKEKALRRFIRAAVYTGMGEFIELLEGTKDLATITKEDIYRIYDLKTAHYTFAGPLACGAQLAGADQKQLNKLHQFGIYLGRAFQIRDDILGLFGEEEEIGKSAFSDLQEAKKTLLLWSAYRNSNQKNRALIKQILRKDKVTRNDLLSIRRCVTDSGALDYAHGEIARMLKMAKTAIAASRMRPKYRNLLHRYAEELLRL